MPWDIWMRSQSFCGRADNFVYKFSTIIMQNLFWDDVCAMLTVMIPWLVMIFCINFNLTSCNLTPFGYLYLLCYRFNRWIKYWKVLTVLLTLYNLISACIPVIYPIWNLAVWLRWHHLDISTKQFNVIVTILHCTVLQTSVKNCIIPWDLSHLLVVARNVVWTMTIMSDTTAVARYWILLKMKYLLAKLNFLVIV